MVKVGLLPPLFLVPFTNSNFFNFQYFLEVHDCKWRTEVTRPSSGSVYRTYLFEKSAAPKNTAGFVQSLRWCSGVSVDCWCPGVVVVVNQPFISSFFFDAENVSGKESNG